MTEKQLNKTCTMCKYYQNTGFPEEYLCGKTMEWFNKSCILERAANCDYYAKKLKI